METIMSPALHLSNKIILFMELLKDGCGNSARHQTTYVPPNEHTTGSYVTVEGPVFGKSKAEGDKRAYQLAFSAHKKSLADVRRFSASSEIHHWSQPATGTSTVVTPIDSAVTLVDMLSAFTGLDWLTLKTISFSEEMIELELHLDPFRRKAVAVIKIDQRVNELVDFQSLIS